MAPLKPQRIRDPVHNLIPFGTDQFENTLWRVIQTAPFQRLRRIRQLGFTDLVFPGATHTRFAHSIGVFHTARQLVRVIRDNIGTDRSRQFGEHQAHVAMAAALVHDVGHGMFSHAFEQVGKKLGISLAQHEIVSERLIRETEIATELNRSLGGGFANDVATLVGRKEPGNLYDAVVSSQFDADRLDYMQRDRMMTGVQSSAIDLTWLLANLEVESVATGADDEKSGSVETLVLGPKAAQVAESYVISLFHLYPNVYLHKATRGAEMLFSALMRCLIRLVGEGHETKTGLSLNHPMIRFARDPNSIEHALGLDDLVFWGALPLLAEAEDTVVGRLAVSLRDRQLLECIDIRHHAESELPKRAEDDRARHRAKVSLACTNIAKVLEARYADAPDGSETVLVDQYRREPYKRYQDSNTPLNRILIRTGGTPPVRDMAELSPVIAGAEPYEICRAYVFRGDTKGRLEIENVMRTEFQGWKP
ncbi:MAG: HD domain-containing protein [Acetobacteraceae bacterium]